MEPKHQSSHLHASKPYQESETELAASIRAHDIFPPVPREQDEDYQLSMEPVYGAHDDLEFHYNNLHGLVKNVVTRNSYVMIGKFVNRVKREEDKLSDLVQRVSQAEHDLEHNPTVDSVSFQIQELKVQVDTMAKRASVLESQCSAYHDEAAQRSEELSTLRSELSEINKDNMTLSYQIDDLLRESPQCNPQRITGGRTLSLGTPFPDGKQEASRDLDLHLSELRESIKRVEDEADNIKEKQATGLADQLTTETFFQDCIKAARRELVKSQELPRDSRGLQGSLYFELLSSRGKPLSSQKTSRSCLQDRDYKNVVYYTVKRMISTARDERRQQQLAAMDIPIDQLRNYSPMQIIGLLCLRFDVISDLHMKTFPANVLRINSQTEEVSTAPKPRKPSLPKITGERFIPVELRMGRSRIGRELREKHSVSIV